MSWIFWVQNSLAVIWDCEFLVPFFVLVEGGGGGGGVLDKVEAEDEGTGERVEEVIFCRFLTGRMAPPIAVVKFDRRFVKSDISFCDA